MPLAATREVIDIDIEQQTPAKKLRLGAQNNSFLRRDLGKRSHENLRHIIFVELASESTDLISNERSQSQSERLVLLLLALLVYNYIHIHNIIDYCVFDWVQNVARGCPR